MEWRLLTLDGGMGSDRQTDRTDRCENGADRRAGGCVWVWVVGGECWVVVVDEEQ